MIEINNKVDCCGCAACANICPSTCIEMQEDKEGFLYPNIDKLKCTSCDLCKTVCPIINKTPIPKYDQEAYIIQNTNKEVLEESTAGGAFTEIARYVLEQGGVVFGVEMDEDYVVRHTHIKSECDLKKFRNSKYVQSITGSSYKEARKYLDLGKLVCYSGTPCQIEGLLTFLRRDYENLILVDVVCRAVPSPGVWKKYISYYVDKHGKQKIIRFRDKTLGYQYSTMKLMGVDGKIHRGGVESQQWLRMFFSGMIIRPSCTKCKFRGQYRNSDFTIWDCFSVHDIDKNFDEKSGTTRILIHSKKGIDIFEKIKSQLIYKKIPVDIAIKGVKEMFDSPVYHKNRTAFFADYELIEFKDLLKKYFPVGLKQLVKKYIRLALNLLGMDIYVKRALRRIKK